MYYFVIPQIYFRKDPTEIAIHAFNDPKVAAVSKISNSETLDFYHKLESGHLFKQGFNFGNLQVATSLTMEQMKRSAVLDVGNFNQL